MWSEFMFLPDIRQWDTLKSNFSEDRLEKGLSRKTSSGRLVVLPSGVPIPIGDRDTTVGKRHISRMGRQTGKGLGKE